MSVTNKEKNFISAVVYLHNDGAQAVRFFKALNAVLDQHFEQYELVAVDEPAPMIPSPPCGTGPKRWKSR